MNIKQAIVQTQGKWLSIINHGESGMPCGFCEKLIQDKMPSCKDCLVSRMLKHDCFSLPSYHTWRHSPTRDNAIAVLEDINRIAKHYHYRQVDVPSKAT